MESSKRTGVRLLLGAVAVAVMLWGVLPLIYFALWPVTLLTWTVGGALLLFVISRR